MTNLAKTVAVLLAFLLLCSSDVSAERGSFKGGGGRGGSGARPSAKSSSRPSTRPASRPSTPSLGGSRPSAKPNVSRPSTSRPSVSRPSTGRPTTSPPQASRPSGGLKPSTRPATRPSSPSTRPATRPSVERPSVGRPDVSRPSTNNRPTTRPSNDRFSPGRPDVSRPTTRPSVPDLGGGGSGNRPGISLPNRPGGGDGSGINLPNRPGGGERPNVNLPNRPGGGGRPSPGDLGDFLGMDKPLRPDGGNRPGLGRPDGPNISDRPNVGDRVNVGDRTNIGDRVNIGNRPNFGNQINIGDINIGNKVINNRPGWVNIDNDRITNIDNRWKNQIGGNRDWCRPGSDRMAYWRGWGDGVRDHWHHHHNHYQYFGADWWRGHPHACGGWHYGYCFNRHPWNYWWTVPTFAACTSWFTWSAPAAVWAEPIYYDYGSGGNVVYENNTVYINNEQIATADEFAQSAAVLATVSPPANEEEAAAVQWMPLGTFAVATNEKDVDPTCTMQLAISQEGIISGTMYNAGTDQAYSVQGQVDKETQRVAFRIGETDRVVIESGLYNLTQDEAPILVHYGTERVENWLLVRLEQPEEDTQASSAGTT